MSRIDGVFQRLRRLRRKGLVVFVTAGDPSLRKTEELVVELGRAGVDLVELGVPFSDPVADGPVIQAASARSLERGTTLESILRCVRRIRRRSSVPIALMSYANPIHHYGIGRFAREAARCGVDGVILPDVPHDEGGEFARPLSGAGIDWILLMAPTSPAQRRLPIGRRSKGFVYYVSLTGVTGVRDRLPAGVERQIRLARRSTRRALCVGFGVSTPEQAKRVSRHCDGVIVGSAVVRGIAEHSSWPASRIVRRHVRPFLLALGRARES